MSNENRIISIAVDPDTEERLKAAAASCDVDVAQICLDLIKRESRRPGFEKGLLFSGAIGGIKKKPLAQIFAECDALTGGVPLGGPDSAELIREIREERMREIERAIADDGSC